ncbi:MAG TPA: hypothetical protein VF402_10605 [Asticcacaulis sp.]
MSAIVNVIAGRNKNHTNNGENMSRRERGAMLSEPSKALALYAVLH